MLEYMSTEIAKNIKGMAETIGKDDSKYWYFAGKVEALSLLKKEMENRSLIKSVKVTKFDIDGWEKYINGNVAGVVKPDEFVYVDTDKVYDKCSLYPHVMKDERAFKQRFKDMFPLRG